jgi:hypothetical protein
MECAVTNQGGTFMRFNWTIAAGALFIAGLPVCGPAADDQRAAEVTAPPAPAVESTPADLLPRNGSFDISSLTSVLGHLLSQGPLAPLPRLTNGQGTQADPDAATTGQAEFEGSDRAQQDTPASGNAVPYGPSFVPRHSRHLSRDAFRQRVYAKRMALVNRIRASAEQSGNEQMAAQANQLEALVNKVHQEGLGGIVQMLGQLQAARQSESAASGTPPAVVPEEDLGEAAPLMLDAPPAARPAPDTAPPKPQPDEERCASAGIMPAADVAR